jgi:hypothetical protein
MFPIYLLDPQSLLQVEEAVVASIHRVVLRKALALVPLLSLVAGGHSLEVRPAAVDYTAAVGTPLREVLTEVRREDHHSLPAAAIVEKAVVGHHNLVGHQEGLEKLCWEVLRVGHQSLVGQQVEHHSHQTADDEGEVGHHSLADHLQDRVELCLEDLLEALRGDHRRNSGGPTEGHRNLADRLVELEKLCWEVRGVPREDRHNLRVQEGLVVRHILLIVEPGEEEEGRHSLVVAPLVGLEVQALPEHRRPGQAFQGCSQSA